MRIFALAILLGLTLQPVLSYASDTPGASAGNGVTELKSSELPSTLRRTTSTTLPMQLPTSQKPAGATARCGDGSWSFDPAPKTACAGHRGIAQWQ
jgi:hypothetical protein